MLHRFDGTMISMISWRTHEFIVDNVNGRFCLEITPQQMIMHHDSDHFHITGMWSLFLDLWTVFTSMRQMNCTLKMAWVTKY